MNEVGAKVGANLASAYRFNPCSNTDDALVRESLTK